VRHVFHRSRSEDGQALVIIVLFMMVMLGFCALFLWVGTRNFRKRVIS